MTTGAIIPHEIAGPCSDAHCWEHDLDEDDAGCYRRCFECRHVFRTADDLVAVHNAEVAGLNARNPGKPPIPDETGPDRIWFCPYCLHDW
jgi:hypothetical protein